MHSHASTLNALGQSLAELRADALGVAALLDNLDASLQKAAEHVAT